MFASIPLCVLCDIVYNYVTKCKNVHLYFGQEHVTTYLCASTAKRMFFFGSNLFMTFSECLIFPSVFCSSTIGPFFFELRTREYSSARYCVVGHPLSSMQYEMCAASAHRQVLPAPIYTPQKILRWAAFLASML